VPNTPATRHVEIDVDLWEIQVETSPVDPNVGERSRCCFVQILHQRRRDSLSAPIDELDYHAARLAIVSHRGGTRLIEKHFLPVD
jgi:hypothetical protein